MVSDRQQTDVDFLVLSALKQPTNAGKNIKKCVAGEHGYQAALSYSIFQKGIGQFHITIQFTVLETKPF